MQKTNKENFSRERRPRPQRGRSARKQAPRRAGIGA